MTLDTQTPGLRPDQIAARLDDSQAERLLPDGAFRLISLVHPESIKGSKRSKTLGQILSLDLAVDDPERRTLLLDAIPMSKIEELESRIELNMALLRSKRELQPPLRRALLGFFGHTIINDHSSVSSEALGTVNPNRGLFPHQKRAASAIERFLYFEGGRAMLHLPTGVGKTRTAMSIIASHLRTRSKGLVLWLAATSELLEQAAVEFEFTWNAVGDRQVDCLRYWSNLNPPINTVSDGIIIAGLAKLHAYGKQRELLWDLGDRTTMVVFDEAHQAVARTYQDIVETVVTRKPRTPLLGLSATPGRTWDDPKVDAAVAELFRGNKVTLDFGHSNPIKHLTEDGYLSKVVFESLNIKSGFDLSSEDIDEISKALDISDAVATRLGQDEQRNLRIVHRLIELTRKHTRILVFAASVDNALLLASICRGVGLKADAVVGVTSSDERKRAIQRFKRLGGGTRILINFGVLTTGFDAPSASAALIARPTKSLVLYSQMVGRVIRGPRAGGTESCEVITVVDTALPGFGDVSEAFMNWEDIWDINNE
ncbi:MAG: DEAD/DEAH box helicase [Gammaproteobacteria bacterium]|nr:DEAD/DEAH box helicase [Gammaproteobacteria bacterium]